MEDFTFDSEYLARLRQRDPVTLTHFCDFFYLPIRNRVRQKVPRDVADDITQEVFAAVLIRIDAGAPQDCKKLPGYIFGISGNLILQFWREGKRLVSSEIELTAFPDMADRADVRLIRELDERRVRKILKKLPPRDGDALERIYLNEQSRAQAAKEMGVTQENLRVILFRALKRFRDEWNRLQQEGLIYE